MDKIKFGETAVLEDGREYNCFANLVDSGKDYIFLISNFEPIEIKIAQQILINGDLQIQMVTDKELKIYLINKFKEKYGHNFNLNINS